MEENILPLSRKAPPRIPTGLQYAATRAAATTTKQPPQRHQPRWHNHHEPTRRLSGSTAKTTTATKQRRREKTRHQRCRQGEAPASSKGGKLRQAWAPA
ncbi:hypothetical protein BVRB_017410 [Beta vulgaris subsp. vulgaris]|uniref:Uncharacterized protein n=1 Tax=Beta vulgaris subsp. vulgaris TaxID=3555 RepID=A0A0J7YM67_BETVV|nr:hypothetical protein BVRB_017410 [Beta vulgaris subsp. vulgaris]